MIISIWLSNYLRIQLFFRFIINFSFSKLLFTKYNKMQASNQTSNRYEQDLISAIRNYDVAGIDYLMNLYPNQDTVSLIKGLLFDELNHSNSGKFSNFCLDFLIGMIKNFGIPLVIWIDREKEQTDILFKLLFRNETSKLAMQMLMLCLQIFSFDAYRDEISNLAQIWKTVTRGAPFPSIADWKSPFAKLYVKLQYVLNDLEKVEELSFESKRELSAEIDNLLDTEDFQNPSFNFFERDIAAYYSDWMQEFLDDQNNDARSYESEEKDFQRSYSEYDSRSCESEEEEEYPKELRFRTSFFLKERLEEDESIAIEYKNFYWKFNAKIDLALSKTICGFLNRDGGRIYLGVDDSNFVVGIKLTAKERDEMKLHILGLVRAFEPSNVNTSQLLSLAFLPIKDPRNYQKIPGLFVVKVIVKPGDPSELYSISKDKCGFYQRNDSQTVELNPTQIFKIRDERQRNHRKRVPDDEFIDPKPENLVDLVVVNNGRRNHKKISSASPSRVIKKPSDFAMNRKGNAVASVRIKGLPKDIEVREAEKYLCLDDFQRDVVHTRIFHERGITNSGEAFVDFRNERAAESYANFVNSYLNISAFLKIKSC